METRMRYLARMVALAIAAAPATALAQMQTYYHAGAWDAFSGRGETGGPVCGVGTTNTTDSRRFSLRFDIGGTTTTLSASKPDWAIPPDTHVTVVMQVGLKHAVDAAGHRPRP